MSLCYLGGLQHTHAPGKQAAHVTQRQELFDTEGFHRIISKNTMCK